MATGVGCEGSSEASACARLDRGVETGRTGADGSAGTASAADVGGAGTTGGWSGAVMPAAGPPRDENGAESACAVGGGGEHRTRMPSLKKRDMKAATESSLPSVASSHA